MVILHSLPMIKLLNTEEPGNHFETEGGKMDARILFFSDKILIKIKEFVELTGRV